MQKSDMWPRVHTLAACGSARKANTFIAHLLILLTSAPIKHTISVALYFYS